MFGNGLLTYLYGIVLGLIVFFVIRSMYSVYYTPGVTTLYDSPVVQAMFPNAKNKLYPSWGFDRAGMYKGPFTFGAAGFWPESGQPYNPTKYGYGGPSPSGGERKTRPIPAEVPIGYWGYAPEPRQGGHVEVYDQDPNIPPQQSVSVGWWGNE